MNINFDEKTKLYTAYQVSDNKPCVAFSESRLEAEQFCFDLVQKNRNQCLQESNLERAAREFVELHKPNKIDVDYIKSGYGSVEGYLESVTHMSDMGEYQIGIHRFDTKSGNPEILSWYADESYQVAWYDLPFEERKTREDHTCEYMFDPDFDWSIEFAKEKIEDGKHDVSVFSLKNGNYQEDCTDYLGEDK